MVPEVTNVLREDADAEATVGVLVDARELGLASVSKMVAFDKVGREHSVSGLDGASTAREEEDGGPGEADRARVEVEVEEHLCGRGHQLENHLCRAV